MKRLLQLGFILGLAGTLAAAYYAPFFEYTRYRSAANVIPNGGRLEQFMALLPTDRIDAAPASRSSAANADAATRISHFKLRDSDGNVIGLVARHAVTIADMTEVSWLVTIPSRGSIVLAASSPSPDSIEAIVSSRGFSPGQDIEPALSIDHAMPAKSVAASGEFSNIDFELVETWVVTGLEEDGQIRGTLSLNTVGRRST